MEKWVDVKGYENLYQVSNYGRVRSLDKVVCGGRNGGERVIKGRMISPTDNGNGYKIVGLTNEGGRVNKYVHRLVAQHFLESVAGKNFVNHIDYDKSNNLVTNLEWCTQGENVRHSVVNMRKPKRNPRQSNTGQKYICKKGNRYAVGIKCRRNGRIISKYKSFSDLESAVLFRDNLLEGVV